MLILDRASFNSGKSQVTQAHGVCHMGKYREHMRRSFGLEIYLYSEQWILVMKRPFAKRCLYAENLTELSFASRSKVARS